MTRAARAAALLREFAGHYAEYDPLAEHLEKLGGLVGAAERAEAAMVKARADEQVLRENVSRKQKELAELSMKLHNAEAARPGSQGVRIR